MFKEDQMPGLDGILKQPGFLAQRHQGPNVISHDIWHADMPPGGYRICTIYYGVVPAADVRNHHGFGMAVCKSYPDAGYKLYPLLYRYESHPSFSVQGFKVLLQEGGPFPVVRIHCPPEMPLVRPVGRIRERGLMAAGNLVSPYCSAAMIEVQVREQNIGYILPFNSKCFQRTEKSFFPVRLEVRPEFIVLFVTNASINQYRSFSIANEQRPHGQRNHIIGVGWRKFRPHAAWYHTKHGTAVEFEKTGQNTVYNHTGQM